MEITRLNQLDLNKIYSYADYYSWKFKERVELIKGKILAMSPAPNTQHQRIQQFISGELYIFLKNKSCSCFSAPFDVRLDKHKADKKVKTVVQPDICVICDQTKLDERGCNGAPELIIEILSPGNSKREMKLKYELYESAGVQEYWIVDPERESVHQFIYYDGKFLSERPLVKGDKVKSVVIKGFAIKVGTIFN
jgi:Uma2 family endonuclease